uniref:KATNIP domain-containing protein n=1 Tax=Acrobeloides nanus TaxID=290746 RepID=A0A914EGU0_9BILA
MNSSNQNGPPNSDSDSITEFAIPELPSGEVLRFLLLSPWDDPFFVGLNAIEIFTNQGTRAEVKKISTNAEQSYGNIESLLVCKTFPFACSDPKGMWMCNYHQSDTPIYVKIELQSVQTIAMIRIWNYCESRVYALRGVHRMDIELDGRLIFRGEISCAFSSIPEGKPLGDTILFTTSDEILNAIAENDVFLSECETNTTSNQFDALSITSDSIGNSTPTSSLTDATIQRPRTGSDAKEPEKSSATLESVATPQEVASDSTFSDTCIIRSKVFHMELRANWGSPDLVGMTGIEFLGKNGEPISTDGCVIRISDGSNDSESLQRLINGRNLTCRPEDMWLHRWDPLENSPMLSFTFPQEVELSGVSVWNYNATPELTYAGVRCAQFYANSRPIVNEVLLRRAPGYLYFDYIQDIMFDRCHLFRPITARPNTRSISAFIFQLRLLSSWGDEFYIGLNGIEVFNRKNHRIRLRPQNLAAFPESINILPSVKQDPRSSANLVDGVNDTTNAHHMWLTPILPNRYARIFIIFDSPTFISRIKIYNYRKTPERGVRHIAISADDLIVYSGEVPESSTEETGILDISLRELD